jgi:hypothetical protein
MSQSYAEFFSAGGVHEDYEDDPLQSVLALLGPERRGSTAVQPRQHGQQQQRSSNAARGGGLKTAGPALAADFEELLGSRVKEVPLSFSLQLGQAYMNEVDWWMKLGDAVAAALQREWEAAGTGTPLRLGGSGRPSVLWSSVKGGLCTCTIHVLLTQEAAQVLRKQMAAGMGGVWVNVEGAPAAVLAHVHEQMNAPTYLFTLTTDSNSYSPQGLQRFIQKQQKLFKGMRVLWMGSTSESAQFIEQRRSAEGELLPQCRCPISLPPFTVVGLAVGGQRVFKMPVELQHGAVAEVFRFRRIPNRVRHLARAGPGEATSNTTSSAPPQLQHTSTEMQASASSAKQQRGQQRGEPQQQQQQQQQQQRGQQPRGAQQQQTGSASQQRVGRDKAATSPIRKQPPRAAKEKERRNAEPL